MVVAEKKRRIRKREDEVYFTVRELNLVERIVRVEEELKAINSNIKILIHQIDKRFETADKRFEELRTDMNKRFNQLTWIVTFWATILVGITVLFKFLW